MTTLRVLLHVAAQRDYGLHSLDFCTAFLQGSLHEEIWLRRPPGFTGSFPTGTQSSLRRPVYGLRQAPREWHDTLRTTLAALGFAPSTADPSLFLCTDTSLPPFYVLVYVNDLVLQRFSFQFSSPQPTPLCTCHSLSAPPSDESVEPSSPYIELVGCLMSGGGHSKGGVRLVEDGSRRTCLSRGKKNGRGRIAPPAPVPPDTAPPAPTPPDPGSTVLLSPAPAPPAPAPPAPEPPARAPTAPVSPAPAPPASAPPAPMPPAPAPLGSAGSPAPAPPAPVPPTLPVPAAPVPLLRAPPGPAAPTPPVPPAPAVTPTPPAPVSPAAKTPAPTTPLRRRVR
ncbi:unnamed protein product [Closterium sp. NIES-54]